MHGVTTQSTSFLAAFRQAVSCIATGVMTILHTVTVGHSAILHTVTVGHSAIPFRGFAFMQRVMKQSPDDKHAVFPNAIFDVATLNTPREAFDRTVVPPSTLLTGQSVSRRLQNGSVCVCLCS